MHAHQEYQRRGRASRPDEAPHTMLESLEARQLLAVDLIAAFINTTPHSLAPGEDFTAAMVVNNDGLDPSGAFSVEMRLSVDTIFGNSDDIVLGTADRPAGLAGSSSTSIVRTFTIPESTGVGSYFLAFSVDPSNAVSESDENNNVYFTASSLITVVAGGDDVDLDVFGNGEEIPDGAHVPSTDNHTLFGDVDVGESIDRVFTLTNNGSGTLQILDITIGGAHSLDFVVVGGTQFSLGAGQSMSLTVRFMPLAEGNRVGQILIQTNDTNDGTGDPSEFAFAIGGLGHDTGGGPIGPGIEVRGNGQVISDGDITPHASDHTTFGRIRLNDASQTRTYTIFNTGDETLFISSMSMIGRNAGDYVILDDIDSIAPGESATFRVRFDPSANGRRVAVVRLLSNDPGDGEFTFKLAGRGSPNGGLGNGGADIAVLGNGNIIDNGDLSPSAMDRTTFGRVARDGQTRARTYTIVNDGTTTLSISSILLTGRDADNFVILDAPGEVAPGSSETFRVRFDPDGLGMRRAEVVINSNDAGDSPFVFRIRGSGVNGSGGATGEIAVFGLLPIFDGDDSPTLIEGTNFGPVNVGQTITRTFIITNTGPGVLNLTGSIITITGRNAPRFSIVQMPESNSLAPDESTTFVVEFTPNRNGRRLATIEVHSTDSDEAVFNFDISARGRNA